MDTYEKRFEAYEAELRDKYNTKEREEAAEKGHALDDGSYPIKDQDDVEKAVKAVGRGNADHDTIRKHIMKRANALGCSDLIPDNWNDDGSLKGENTARRKKPRHRSVPIKPEVRYFQATGLEVRSAASTDEITISGSPIVFNTPYPVRDFLGEFQETMMPGVASRVMSEGADVRFLFNHDGLPLARSTAGTMTLTESGDRLDFTARLDARQQLANDLAIAIERGDVTQMSCGFIVARDQWDDAEENRTIYEFDDLLDVSAVTYPASPTTHIQVAQRMALAMPIESRARLRNLIVAERVGSASEESRARAAGAIGGVLLDLYEADGRDPEELEDERSDAEEQRDEAVGGSEQPSGGRSAVRLDLEIEARRRRKAS